MIKEAYVGFEVAKLLKEKGFNELCFRLVRNDGEVVEAPSQAWNGMAKKQRIEFCLCPTHQMAMAWLMEVHNLYICPKYCCFCGSKPNDRPYFKWEARILKLPLGNIIYPQPLDMCDYYETYEEAVEAALKVSLENLI